LRRVVLVIGKDQEMKNLKPAMFALLAAMAFTAPAFAQGTEGIMVRDNTITIVMPNGHTMTMPISGKAQLDMAMKGAKPVAAGQIFIMSGGKLYMIEDTKMPDGKMLWEHIGGRA